MAFLAMDKSMRKKRFASHLWFMIRSTEPEQAVNDQFILNRIIKLERQFFIGFMLVINVIMPHINVQHFVFRVCPHYRIIAAVPNFMRFRPCTKREAR